VGEQRIAEARPLRAEARGRQRRVVARLCEFGELALFRVAVIHDRREIPRADHRVAIGALCGLVTRRWRIRPILLMREAQRMAEFVRGDPTNAIFLAPLTTRGPVLESEIQRHSALSIVQHRTQPPRVRAAVLDRNPNTVVVRITDALLPAHKLYAGIFLPRFFDRGASPATLCGI